MIKKIDLFSPPLSQYRALHYMTEKFGEALTRQGIECRVFDSRSAKDPQAMIDSIRSHKPDVTLSFNGLLPDKNGNFFCDLLRIPHVACLVDSPVHFFSLVQSPLSIITCMDRFFCDFFRSFDFKNVAFLPHGADSALKTDPAEERPYDIVLLSTYLDPEEIKLRWKRKYNPTLCAVLEEAAEVTLSDQTTSFIQAFTHALNHPVLEKTLDPRVLNFESLLADLEDYIRAKDRLELIKGIRSGHLHIFGEGNWKKITSKLNTKVSVHSPLPFVEALEVMKKSKVVLNSSPTVKNGDHIRALSAMACGAVCLTSENPYMTEHFKEGKDILYYRHGHWNEVDAALKQASLDVAAQGQKKVLTHHTFDNRARSLIESLTNLLKNM